MPGRLRLGRVAASVMGITVISVLPTYLTGSLAVQISRELRFGPVALGAAVSGFSLASAIGSVALGRAADRVGWGRALTLSGLTSSLVLLAMGTAVRSWTVLAGLLVVAGFSNALTHPAANLALARSIPVGSQGLLFGIKQAGLPTATLLGGLSVPILALRFGWRSAFLAAALVGVSSVLTIPGKSAAITRESPEGGSLRDSDGLLIYLALAAFLGLAAAQALAVFLVAAGVAAGLSEGAAGQLLAAGSAVSLAVRVLVGWRADRRRREVGMATVAGLLLLGSAGYLLLSWMSGVPLMVGALVAFGAGWGWTGLFNLAVVRLRPSLPASATGVTQMGVYLGAASGPLAFGWVVEHASFELAWRGAGLAALAGAAVVAVISRRA